MRKSLTIVAVSLLVLTSACNSTDSSCFPGEKITKAVILVADTTILGRELNISNNPTKITRIDHGIGFVTAKGEILQKPSFRLEISGVQLDSLLKIFRPTKPLDESIVTDCTPIYRHAILLYDKEERLKGQINICFDCSQASFIPKADCLTDFDQQRFPELDKFISSLNIPTLHQ